MIHSILYFEENCIKIFEKLENDFLRNPKNFAEYVYGIVDELYKLGKEMLKESIETMNQMLRDSLVRRKKWTVESHTTKTLTTLLGDITFQKTLFQNKETKEYAYLLDHILGLEPNQRLSEDAAAQMLKEAVQTSYQRGAKKTSLTSEVSRQTVKNKIHSLQFPPERPSGGCKKIVDYLYIDADEDHVALQFCEKKGDIVKAENGVKNNGLLAKLVYIYEGKENEAFQSRRRVLINPHYFCSVNSREENHTFWDRVYDYIEQNYELSRVKKIYLNADGGSWIREGKRAGVCYVLDGFHLEKYLLKLVSYMKKEERAEALEEFHKTICGKTKADFRKLAEKQKEKMPKWRNQRKIDEAADYILSNWSAAKLRLKKREGVVGSSTEGHVSIILSERMSSRPMGWSREGAGKMAELRAYYFNGGDMLELVRYQKKEAEKKIEKEEMLSSTQITASEKNRHEMLGKYVESISHSVSEQAKKIVYFNTHIWGI